MRVLFWMSTSLDRHTTSEHLLKDILQRLCECGNEVHIIQKNTDGELAPIPIEIKNYHVSTTRIKANLINKTNLIGRLLSDIRYVLKSKKYISKDVEAIFIQSSNVAWLEVWIARRKNRSARITYNAQDVFPHNAYFAGKMNSFLFRIVANVQKYAYLHSDNIITISEDIKQLLVKEGVDPAKVLVVYNWSYQDEVVSKDMVKRPANDEMFDKSTFNVVYAGNIGVMQNVDIIIDTALLMKDDKSVRFYIIGDGVYKNNLQKIVKEKGLDNVSFMPMQPSSFATYIYTSADVNVVPLKRDIAKTALPSKTATCLACQKPIIFAIGKDTSFGKEVQRATHCPVVNSDSPEDLKEELYKIQNGTIVVNTRDYYLSSFSKKENSQKYADIITGQTINYI